MVVKNQKNLIHDVVMNFIPKKKTEPPKVSLEQMVKDHAKQNLINSNITNNINKIQDSKSNTNLSKSKESINIISEIENKIKDKPITISKVEGPDINDIIMSIGGAIQKKYNSRKKSRNHVKSTVEKLIDTKLKSEFIENFKNNNTQHNKVIVEKTKSPSKHHIRKSSPDLIKLLANKNFVENSKKIPTTKKYKSETNTNQKSNININKDKLLHTDQLKNYNSLTNNCKNNFSSKNTTQNILSNSNKKYNLIDSKRINRTNNYINNNNNNKKNENEINSNSFRNYEIKIKNSRKNSKKNDKKKSKKYRSSKKSKTKTKSTDVFNNIKLEKNIPNYLKNDLKQLIGKNIKIHNDSLNL
jgi:hypothetical protein